MLHALQVHTEPQVLAVRCKFVAGWHVLEGVCVCFLTSLLCAAQMQDFVAQADRQTGSFVNNYAKRVLSKLPEASDDESDEE